jgi:hypothetical protein
MARDVSAHLKSKLSGAEETQVTKIATSDPAAYQAYLKGRYYWNRRTAENLKKAIEQFKLATERDPNYALAFVGHSSLKIIELDPNFAAGYQYLGLSYLKKDKAFEWLEKDFQARDGKLAEIKWQLQFESLRDDPRFSDLLKRMGLPG